MTNYDQIWACVEQLNEASTIVEARNGCKALEVQASAELSEVLGTVGKAKAVLLPLLNRAFNNTAFDVSLQAVAEATSALLQALIDVNAADSEAQRQLGRASEAARAAAAKDSHAAMTRLLRLDFLLTLRLEVLQSLLCGCPECQGVPEQAPELRSSFNSAAAAAPRPRSCCGLASPSSQSDALTDRQGSAFWGTTFGVNTRLVPWKLFYASLATYLSITCTDQEERELRACIDFTQNGFVSRFEFGLFLRWFGPMLNSTQNCLAAISAGILAGFVTVFETSHMLEGKPRGSFVMRFSKSRPDAFGVALVTPDGRVMHSLLGTQQPAGIVVRKPDGSSTVFSNLMELYRANERKLAAPLGPGTVVAVELGLRPRACETAAVEAAQTAEEGDRKAADSSVFAPASAAGQETKPKSQMCVVCMDAAVETVFLECGHICCCRACSTKLSKCPICRKDIMRFVPVFMP